MLDARFFDSPSDIVECNAQFMLDWHAAVEGRRTEYYSDALVLPLNLLNAAVLLGEVVLDIDCGPLPVSGKMDLTRHKRILVDSEETVHLLANNQDEPAVVQAKLDIIGRYGNPDTPFYDSENQVVKRYRQAVANASHGNGVDVLIANMILNYIPYQDVLRAVDHDLKPGAVVFIGHRLKGYEEMFHAARPISHEEVFDFCYNSLGYRRMMQWARGLESVVVARKPYMR